MTVVTNPYGVQFEVPTSMVRAFEGRKRWSYSHWCKCVIPQCCLAIEKYKVSEIVSNICIRASTVMFSTQAWEAHYLRNDEIPGPPHSGVWVCVFTALKFEFLSFSDRTISRFAKQILRNHIFAFKDFEIC